MASFSLPPSLTRSRSGRTLARPLTVSFDSCIHRVRAASHVAHLDWADAPMHEATSSVSATSPCAVAAVAAGDAHGETAPLSRAGAPAEEEDEACRRDGDAMLRGRFDLILMADVINADGLSELVYEVLQRYLAPHGLIIMACPKPRHRHTGTRAHNHKRNTIQILLPF